MKNSTKHSQNITSNFSVGELHIYQGGKFDQPIAFIFLLLMSPIFIMNILTALFTKQPVLTPTYKTDALGRAITIHNFSRGICRQSALLIDIIKGQLGLCGVPLTHSVSNQTQYLILNNYQCKAGIFSLYNLHQRSGLAVNDAEELLLKQLNSSVLDSLLLIIKSIVCQMFFSHGKDGLDPCKKISLFGLNVNNISMPEAINWATSNAKRTCPEIGFFINVNSINLAIEHADFHQNLQHADMLLADGSGIRIAAKTAGYLLQDNNNGTDMLPHLCSSCVKKHKSLYLFGSAPGVAESAAKKLKKQFPNLIIAGTQHGFIENSQTEQVINAINNSGCHILLVAMGSPIQEQWLLEHRGKLQCQTALAVGGLFDFYSGKIARSPMWLRELGLEWIWRLSQEPVTKFKRYVIGNPLFLFRIYILGLASKGVK